MSDRDALIAAIIAHPEEDTPRLMLADWYQEDGRDQLAIHIRWAVGAPQNHVVCLCGCKGRKPNPCEACQLFDDIVSNIPRRTDGESHYVAHRGFVCEVRLSPEDWYASADAILKQHPIKVVRMSSIPPVKFEYLGGDTPQYVHLPGRIKDKVQAIPRSTPWGHAKRCLEANWPGIKFEPNNFGSGLYG